MTVSGLDHVNIVTADIAETRRFYQDLLGLGTAQVPPLPDGMVVNWLADTAGRPILHIQQYNPDRHGPTVPSGPTGAVDHVALECQDFDGQVSRCEKLGVPYRTNIVGDGLFRQVFVNDPNGLLLELNFRG